MTLNLIKRLQQNAKMAKNTILKIQSDINDLKISVNELKKETDANKKYLLENVNQINANINQLETRFNFQNLRHSHDKKQILVAGFFGAFNLGDEIMLQTILGELSSYPNIEVTIMLSENYSCDLTKYSTNKFIFYPKSIFEMQSLANYFDTLIFAGGALIDDNNYSTGMGQINLGSILVNLGILFNQNKKRTIFYGLSSNTNLTNSNFTEKLQKVIQDSSLFLLRDSLSLETITSSNINTSKIKIVDDLAFANKDLYAFTQKPSTSNHNQISLIYVFTEETYPKLLTFTKKLLDYLDNEIKLKIIPFYDYTDNDLMFANRLTAEINSARLETLSKIPLEAEDLGKIINSSLAVISMRYHGTLISNFLRKKTLCINYDIHDHYPNKNKYLYDYYKFPKLEIKYSNLGLFDQKIITKLLNVKPISLEEVEKIHKKATKCLEENLKNYLREE